MDISKDDLRALTRTIENSNYEQRGHPSSMNGPHVVCKNCSGWQDSEDYGRMKHDEGCQTVKDKEIADRIKASL